MEMVKYDAACRAVAEAKTVDECKEFLNRAEAARAYAKQAGNRQLEMDASEIRVRAERRLGSILLQMKQEGMVAVQGVRDNTSEGGRTVLRLSELGIEKRMSAISQRLAMLPEDRFQTEMDNWRDVAESSARLETPLQHYRIPSRSAACERQSFRRHPNQVDVIDTLDRFRALDGRRIADWRIGELRRVADLSSRILKCAQALIDAVPVANADQLATVEMIFPRTTLLDLLNTAWGERVAASNSGLNGRVRQTRICENCGDEFTPKSGLHKARVREGVYCSRKCQHARKSKVQVQ